MRCVSGRNRALWLLGVIALLGASLNVPPVVVRGRELVGGYPRLLEPGTEGEVRVRFEEPGSYEAFCPVRGHREKGQFTVLSVGPDVKGP